MSSMSSARLDTDAGPGAAVAAARRQTGLRRNSVGISVMLIAQYVLGMAINLYVTVPPGASMAHLPAAVTAHAVFGLFLLVAGISVLIRAFLARMRVLILTSSAGLLAIIGAIVAGAMFTGNERVGSSMAMAVATGVAQLCYLANVTTARPR